jgi:DNA polymerase I-like protein with 3'-5' exonuclease and polymerase domains
VAPLLELRSEEKLRGTYLVPLLKEADEKHIVHPNFNQFGTGTGRFSSGAVK